METNKANYTYSNNTKSKNFPINNTESINMHKNTIKEEENDEEFDQSIRFDNNIKKSEKILNVKENEINEDSDQDDYIEQNNIFSGEEGEEDEDFIDFNNQNAYESDSSLQKMEQEKEREFEDSDNYKEEAGEKDEEEEIKHNGMLSIFE